MRTIDELGISPAPWTVRKDVLHYQVWATRKCDHTEEPWIIMDDNHYIKEVERKANARLIAAAPELYEALRRLLAVARNRLPSQPTLDEIEVLQMVYSAIAKASGEEAR